MNLLLAGKQSRVTRYWDIFFSPGERLLRSFSRLDQSNWPILWVIGFFLVQALPASIIKSANLEEGRILAIARGAMEDGHWLSPFIYGERFPERPVLLSWIAARFGEVTGGVTLWSLRLPHLCFFLAGALLIYNLLRGTTGKSAAVFGSLCWISMPLVAPKFINAEPDIVLSTLLFAAFCVWWSGTSSASMTPARWFGVVVLVALAGLTKGPQPVAYFTLGVGAYIALKQRDQIVAFIVANLLAGLAVASWYVAVYEPNDLDLWAAHSRLSNTTTGLDTVRGHLNLLKSLIFEWLPGTILLAPAILMVTRAHKTSQHDLMLAAVLYTATCTLVLIFWPGKVAARYTMPATMTLAIVCGLMFDRWRNSHPRVIVSALVVTCLIFGGLLVRGWVAMPFWPHLFNESRIAGRAVSSVLEGNPATLYVIGSSTDHNLLSYVRGRIRAVTIQDLAQLQTRSIAVLRPEELEALAVQVPGVRLTDLVDLRPLNRPFKVVEIAPN